jgi:Flp pilus assembly protein TadG
MMVTRGTRDSERGSALVEFAIVLPLVLVLIAGVVDFGFLFQRYEVITNAAREGARLASLPGYTCATGGVVEARVRAYVQTGLQLINAQMATAMPSGAVTITCPTLAVPITGGGTVNIPTARVQVSYTHSFILLGSVMALVGGSWGNSTTLVATSQMRQEAAATGS